MLKNLLRSSLCFILFLGLGFPEVNLSFSHHNDNQTFYSLYGAGFNVSNESYRYYITGEYYNSQATDRLDVFTGLDWTLSDKITPFVFINYFYNTRLNSDFLRSGIGSYYMLNEFIVKHRVSLAIVSETGRDRHMLSWRYRAYQDFGKIGFRFVVNIIEHEVSTKTEWYYRLSKQINLSYVSNSYKSIRGEDVSSTIGVDIRF